LTAWSGTTSRPDLYGEPRPHSLTRLRLDLGRAQLEVGPGELVDEPTAAHTLYNLIDRRHGQVSTAVTSNIALSEWGRYLGDATLNAAILDRLAMHAIRIDISGPSYRQHVAKSRAERAPAT
jgi:hypothetical protein